MFLVIIINIFSRASHSTLLFGTLVVVIIIISLFIFLPCVWIEGGRREGVGGEGGDGKLSKMR